jgi:Lar family restriction alleviation protein
MIEYLKTCPFCGGEAATVVRVTQMGGNSDYIDFSVVCVNCKTEKMARLRIEGIASFSDVEKAMQRVTEMWNQRV